MLRRARAAGATSGCLEVSGRARAHGRGRRREHRPLPLELHRREQALAFGRADDGRSQRGRSEVEVKNRPREPEETDVVGWVCVVLACVAAVGLMLS